MEDGGREKKEPHLLQLSVWKEKGGSMLLLLIQKAKSRDGFYRKRLIAKHVELEFTVRFEELHPLVHENIVLKLKNRDIYLSLIHI